MTSMPPLPSRVRRPSSLATTASLMLLALVLPGCALGPGYRRPNLPAPQAWRTPDSLLVVSASEQAAADTSWWRSFGDPVLDALVLDALTHNSDIRIAAARVDEYRARYGVARSDLTPKVGLSAGGARGQFSAVPPGPDGRPTTEAYEVRLNATWELDLWGRVRRASQAASADLQATEELRRGVVMSVVSLTAEGYIQLLALDRKLEYARETETLRARSRDLFRQRLAKGDLSELEMSQIESQYWSAVAQVHELEAAVKKAENALSVLVGRLPSAVERGATIDSLRTPVVPVGLPSTLLERRPDVRESEAALRSAQARIGVAKARLFPTLSLTGLFGFTSPELSDLVQTPNRIWDVGAGLFEPVFRGGELFAQVRVAESVQRRALEDYAATVRNAFRDADDALTDRASLEKSWRAQAQQVAALETYLRLARMRYSEGVTSYLEVLDADRSLYAQRIALVDTRSRLLRSTVGVYRAFGGGWVDEATMQATQTQESGRKR